MRNSFKLSTNVVKAVVFAVFLASFTLSAVKAEDSFKAEDQRILSHLRLKLWYQGLDEPSSQGSKRAIDPKEMINSIEELRLPMEKLLNVEKR